MITQICKLGCCIIKFCPLVIAFGRTIHIFQGQEAGPEKSILAIIVNPGPKHFEKSNPGTLNCCLARASTLGEYNIYESAFSFFDAGFSMGAVLAPQKIPGLRDNGFNLYDHNQLNQINEKLNKIQSGKIAIVIMGMPYKCPPAPFEASLLVDSMLRKRGIRIILSHKFYK